MSGASDVLKPDETVLWTGQPVQGLTLRSSDALMIPFSLLWGGFALFWNLQVWAINAPWVFKLFGLPFLAVGAYLALGRFFIDARRRARTHYAVTTERVLLSEALWGEHIQALSISDQTPITTIRQGARETLAFGDPTPLDRRRGSLSGRRYAFAFEDITPTEATAATEAFERVQRRLSAVAASG